MAATGRKESVKVFQKYFSLLGLKDLKTPQLIRKVKKGLPFKALKVFSERTEIPQEVAAHMVQITPRTLARRKEEGRLHADESDRLVRISRVCFAAINLFEGNTLAARQWLNSPQPALGGATPLDYASTEIGSREVESLIGRLEHGIPS